MFAHLANLASEFHTQVIGFEAAYLLQDGIILIVALRTMQNIPKTSDHNVSDLTVEINWLDMDSSDDDDDDSDDEVAKAEKKKKQEELKTQKHPVATLTPHCADSYEVYCKPANEGEYQITVKVYGKFLESFPRKTVVTANAKDIPPKIDTSAYFFQKKKAVWQSEQLDPIEICVVDGVAGDSTLFVLREEGCLILNAEDHSELGTLRYPKEAPGKLKSRPRSIQVDPTSGTIYVANEKGISIFEPTRLSFVRRIDIDLSYNIISRIVLDEVRGRIYGLDGEFMWWIPLQAEPKAKEEKEDEDEDEDEDFAPSVKRRGDFFSLVLDRHNGRGLFASQVYNTYISAIHPDTLETTKQWAHNSPIRGQIGIDHLGYAVINQGESIAFVKGTFVTTDLTAPTADEDAEETTVYHEVQVRCTKGFAVTKNGKLFAIDNNNSVVAF